MGKRTFAISALFEKKLGKLQRKNSSLYNKIVLKMNEVLSTPDLSHYKNLKYNLKNCKRVHVGSYVFTFQYILVRNHVFFDDVDHHDKIYKT
jgi:mRNA-degrading endonuclease RelE of RelBE toxin-antitoxin system